MNKKTVIAAALTVALAVSGCVSVESTRAQLSSSNPQEIQKAEQNILRIATTGKDASGFINFDARQQVEYVNLAQNNDLLFKIMEDSYQSDILSAAAAKIDFSKPGVAMEIVKNHNGLLKKIRNFVPSDRGQFEDKVLAKLDETELRETLDLYSDGRDYELKQRIARKLAAITHDVQLLMSFYDGDRRSLVADNDRDSIVLKLAGMSDRIDDPKTIVEILNAIERRKIEHRVKSGERENLISRLGGDDALKYALDKIELHSVYDWNEGMMLPLTDALSIAKGIGDSASVTKIVSAILAKLASYEKSCKDSWTMKWTKEDEIKAKSLVRKFPKLSDETIESLICADETSWAYFINRVSVDMAYDILAGGKAKSAALEIALVKKLPANRIDMKVYKGVRFDDARKAANAAMPAEMKKQAAEEEEKAFASIIEKAKAASKETFEMNGFYLGMSFDDVKVLLSYYFPDWQIEEAVDGKSKDAAHIIYIPGQSSPFCYASASNKKVYRFNFGKKVLKKWYKYDVQTYMEWAHAYEREMKIDMKYRPIEKDTTVYEMDMSRSYRVWFHQESYQYKHNTKEYRLTYFGEEKDFTVEGGLGGAIIKEMAAPRFRYVRGDPGSLRAVVERD